METLERILIDLRWLYVGISHLTKKIGPGDFTKIIGLWLAYAKGTISNHIQNFEIKPEIELMRSYASEVWISDYESSQNWYILSKS